MADMRDFPEVYTVEIDDNGREVGRREHQISIADMERLCAEHPDRYRCEQRDGRRVMVLSGFEKDHYYVEQRVYPRTDETQPETVMVMQVTEQGLRARL
ncbi:hypothetical protein [Shimazuella kribbensis]|uniref:hypothetical protein n=1 Tax=Shimazuella kribbensis TaxID=139808 RepID=UPI00048C8655|nr:hypothetical protein [Shimazuella kribbensis]